MVFKLLVGAHVEIFRVESEGVSFRFLFCTSYTHVSIKTSKTESNLSDCLWLSMILFDSLMLFASWLSFDVVPTISRNGRFTGFGSAGIQIQASWDGKHPRHGTSWDCTFKHQKAELWPAKTCSTIKVELNHFEPLLFVSGEKGRHVPSCTKKSSFITWSSKQQGNREIEEKC